ncbi:PAS and ANTAR domain-containing protein [Cellulomonas sp. PhB143]|uniref:PAS and ANTAR domain-containing protein n=1 Tax=Cellulomonas sp. PhB143 TaxID=2485186 RepID=UPI000F46D1D7|nr:PAS and ANTAR domain-containing protein [Cellulomonas sp. PhB143]ROS73300.1 PAS domain-containing protein [Cellulomonas sp. PhB143]
MATDDTEIPTTPWDVSVEDALGGGRSLPIGQYRTDLSKHTWWWSDEVYLMLGLTPGSVEPSAELLAAHKHQDDRGRVAREVSLCRRTGRPFSFLHRIVDSRGRTRTVTVTGQGRRDGTGQITEIAGYVVDQSAAQRELLDRDVNRLAAAASAERTIVERAKGVLMAVYGMDESTAADRLVWYSSHAGLRVHDVAARLVESFDGGPGLGGAATEQVDAVLNGLSGADKRRPRNAQLTRHYG